MSCIRRKMQAHRCEPALALAFLAVITLAAWTLPNLASGHCQLSLTSAMVCHEQSSDLCQASLPSAGFYACLMTQQSESLDGPRGSSSQERETRLLARGLSSAPIRNRTMASTEQEWSNADRRTAYPLAPQTASTPTQSAWSGFMTPLLA